MNSLQRIGAIAGTLCTVACEPKGPAPRAAERMPATRTANSTFASVPDSTWVAVDGPTLIAFYPVVSNEQLEKDEGLATALDDLSYHLGTAMDSLQAIGFTVHYRGGDTLWLRTGAERVPVVRASDSATVGYVFADSLRRRVFVYGVRTYIDLVEFAHEFKRTGTIAAR